MNQPPTNTAEQAFETNQSQIFKSRLSDRQNPKDLDRKFTLDIFTTVLKVSVDKLIQEIAKSSLFTITLAVTGVSFASYHYIYHTTENQSKQWFTLPDQEERITEPNQTASLSLYQSLMANDTSTVNALSIENYLEESAEDILLKKKSDFDLRVEELKARLSALQGSQLSLNAELETQLQTIINSETKEEAQEHAEELLHLLQELSIQDSLVGRISKVTIDLNQKMTELLDAANPAEVQASVADIKTLLQSLMNDASTMNRINQEIANEMGKINQEIDDFSQRSYEQVRLLEQLEASEDGAERHANLAIHFYSQAKAFTFLSILLGVIAGALSVLNGRQEKSTQHLVNGFLIVSAAALLFSQLPRAFKTEANFQSNRDLYLKYLTLKNSIHSFAATEGGVGNDPEQPEQFDQIDTNRFIHSVDKKLVELNTLSIGIDSTQTTSVADDLNIPTRTPQPQQEKSVGGDAQSGSSTQ